MANSKRPDEVDLRNVSTTAYRQLREAGYEWTLSRVETEIHNLLYQGDSQGSDQLVANDAFAIVFTRPGFCRVYVQAGTMRHD